MNYEQHLIECWEAGQKPMSYEEFNSIKQRPMAYSELKMRLLPSQTEIHRLMSEQSLLRKQYIEENRKFQNGQWVRIDKSSYCKRFIVVSADFDYFGKDHGKIAYSLKDDPKSLAVVFGVAEDRLTAEPQVEITDLKETDHGRICVDT